MANHIVYNFGAGPACLPPEVLQQIRADIPDWFHGMSVMEISHRLPVFLELIATIEKDLRTLLAIPEEFAVLFMAGGARTQYSAIPLNLLNNVPTADYLVTGQWSLLAYQDAEQYCQAQLVASSQDQKFIKIPDLAQWKLNTKSAYFHYADNETIHGVEFKTPPQIQNKWLISDMTSNIMTKEIDWSLFGLVYASAQKNLGIAGISVVIVRKELLGQAHPLTPKTLNYEICHTALSLFNTPPVFCWYVLGLVLKWQIAQGGVTQMHKLCEQKSQLVYDLIDQTDFYQNPVFKADRSRINIPFHLANPELEALFLKEAAKVGLEQLKGHKNVGGCRASLYNAMPLAGVQSLVNFMQNFAQSHG